MIVPTGLMHHETAADGSTRIRVETPDGMKTYPTTELFRRQVADKLKIPFAYFELNAGIAAYRSGTAP